ncbi:unnamed protein product [Schistosoma margrebowiei]|uniref:Uncharacterized protein n=1 Tax=Schistosoma margrebowiei TaxID=48269 RepID=A0A3P8A3C9_9TREM|nr:unnamed protein product [Schistosoma margrebowiei]
MAKSYLLHFCGEFHKDYEYEMMVVYYMDKLFQNRM